MEEEVVYEIYVASAWDRDGLSTHHWYLTKNGKRTKRWTTRGYESNRIKAIEETMARALRFVEKKGLVGVTFKSSDVDFCIALNKAVDDYENVSTNMKYIVNKLYQYECQFELVREHDKKIKLAYHYCNELMETIKRRDGVSA